MGGPAHHVTLLSGLLDPDRYETLLLHGEVGAGEASLEAMAEVRGAHHETVPGLRPELRPTDDLRALWTLIRKVRAFRPDIVHTHTAKAGLLGRLAAVLGGRPRPRIVHTYHGHVLEGYFGPLKNGFYRTLERLLARLSDVLIGVSTATVDDLVRLRVAPRQKFRVIPIGLDLDPFLASDGENSPFRGAAGATDHEVLLTWVGRLVPIKRVDVLLRAMAHARAQGAPVRLAIVGDGEERPALEQLADELGITAYISFMGYRADMVEVASASDLAVLSSDNEGTPVSLIEAAAAGAAAVATRVGGVADVVTPETGILVPAGDSRALGEAVTALATDPAKRRAMGQAARDCVRTRFSIARLLEDVERLYEDLMQDPTHAGNLTPRAR
jgi:glycosyltransferase involved in cell wall biosynthesis